MSCHHQTILFISDPSSVNLEKVSNIIIDQSLKDQVFSKEAGRICYTIVQVRTITYWLSPSNSCLNFLFFMMKTEINQILISSTNKCVTFVWPFSVSRRRLRPSRPTETFSGGTCWIVSSRSSRTARRWESAHCTSGSATSRSSATSSTTSK